MEGVPYLMIVCYFNFVRSAFCPGEADSELVIDADAMLTDAIRL